MTEKKVQCPCGTDAEPTFIGATTASDEYGTRTQYAWFCVGHYFYVVVKAPYAPHGRGGSLEITMDDPGLGPRRPVKT